MKKHLLFISFIVSSAAYAQAPEDALRYSFYPQNGTARNMAIGGAMGSLGGDINATFVNPAGLGFYKTGEVAITPALLMNNNKYIYRGTGTSGISNSMSFGTSGVVVGFGEKYKDRSSSNAISFAVTQTANFNKKVHYSGYNNYSSFSEQFAEEFAKSGYTIDEVLNNNYFPFSSNPALYTYLIDTTTINGHKVVKGAPEKILDAGQSLWQDMNQVSKGAITELALGFGHGSNDKWFFGGTIGIPIYQYHSITTYQETDTSSNAFNGFKHFTYNDDLKTTGVGINAKLGIIYRPQDYIRIGFAIHTPTFSQLQDTRTTVISTDLETPSGQPESFTASSSRYTNNEALKNKYQQQTPFKAILSASYVFREVENVKRQKGFITADVEYVHHKGSKFTPIDSDEQPATEADKQYYKDLTSVIKQIYKGAFNFRVGGELKFNTIMGRLGFAYYGNPYKDAELKANRMLLSGGLGYRNKGVFVDLTYVYTMTKDANFPYRLEDRSNTYASAKEQRGNIVATVGFKF